MAMIKIVSPSGWDFDAPTASIIKYGSRGLIGNDRSEFIKRAGEQTANAFLPYLDLIKFAADEEPVHLISHGATEKWGANRNGDGFLAQTCRDHCDTFEKFARFYRNHANKDPSNSYGVVKKAVFHETMQRVELLVGLNKTAAAAARNGGFIADRELEKLARGKDLAVSMACRVPHDTCSYCKHNARTRAEYCTADTCKAGGCRDNLTRVVKLGNDVHHLHVDNHNPAWFDISDVLRPADPTAYGHRADWLSKAAADSGFLGDDGAKLAEDMGMFAPMGVILYQDAGLLNFERPGLGEQIKLAYGLDSLEKQASFSLPDATCRAFSRDVQGELNLPDTSDRTKLASALAALADQKIVIPLRDFAVLTKRAELASDAAACLRGVYGRMIADGSLQTRLIKNAYAFPETLAPVEYRRAAERLWLTHSLEKDAVDRRCMQSALRQYPTPAVKTGFALVKVASANDGSEALARDYACYKIAALHRIAQVDPCFLLTARYAATQNQVN